MSEPTVNSDLLLCENQFYTKTNEVKSLLITKKAQKEAITASKDGLKTQRIASSVLSRAKEFLDKTKDTPIETQTCDLVDDKDTDECPTDGKSVVELDFVLFANKDHSDSEEEETSDSSESSDEDSEEDSNDSVKQSDNESKCVDK